jgi:hypothetical protein
MGDSALHNRKTSPYIPRNEQLSTSNRKISAYFTLAGYLIKDKTSNLNGTEMKTIARRALMYDGEPYHKLSSVLPTY